MPTPGKTIGSNLVRARGPRRTLTTIVAVLTLVGCTGNGSPPDPPTPEPSPTSTAEPGTIRYARVTPSYCEDVALYRIPNELDLYVPDLDAYYSGKYTDAAPAAWQASCRFVAQEAADSSEFGIQGHVDVTVFADPADAREVLQGWYREWEELPSQFPVVEQITGWWSDAAYAYGVERKPERYRDRQLALDYRILHDNLFLTVDMGADFNHEDTERVLSLAHQVARALVDAAAEQVPLAD